MWYCAFRWRTGRSWLYTGSGRPAQWGKPSSSVHLDGGPAEVELAGNSEARVAIYSIRQHVVLDSAIPLRYKDLHMNFDRFDICEAYCVLEWDWNKGGWLSERPSNRRRREATSIQLGRI